MAQRPLGADDVHLWRVTIARETAKDLVGLLDEAERRSAAAFRFDPDRDRYVVSRGVVRALLSRYLDRDPRQLRFYPGPYQKPALVPIGPAGAIQFNVAHSGDVALVVISRDRAVGVDVERIRTDLPIEHLAGQAFSPRELATLLSLSGAQRVRAFFACWTRKEAYLKARGTGLARDLKEFDVTLAPGQPASLLADRAEPAETSRWSLRDLPVRPGYAAALAAAGTDWRLSTWQWKQ